MNGLRIGITFVIVLVLFLLSVFQMQLRGYEKIGRAEDWTVYYENIEDCDDAIELFYTDDEYNYYFTCIKSDRYIIKRGFEEYSLVFALENDYITISELEDIIDYFKEPISN